MSDAPGLDELAEAVARRVVELLADQPSSPAPPANTGPRLLTARQVADRLGRSTNWVRSHRAELGQVPGVGARPRLLFDAAAVDRWATARAEIVRHRRRILPPRWPGRDRARRDWAVMGSESPTRAPTG